MAIRGLIDTNSWVTDERPKNYREGIMRLDPNGDVPFTALTSRMRTRTVDDPEFNWWERTLQSQRVELNENLDGNSGTQTIAVKSGATKLRAGHVLRVEESEEVLYVTSNSTDDTSLEVERGFSGTSPTSVDYDGASINPNIHVIGSAFPEGSGAPSPLHYQPKKFYNYTQIFRHSIALTNTARRTRLRTPEQVARAKKDALFDQTAEFEKAVFFGRRFEGTGDNGQPLRTMGGIDEWLPSERKLSPNSGSSMDMSELEEKIKTIFEYGSDEKVGFCGNAFMMAINQVARKNSSLEITSEQESFGMNVTRVRFPHGTLVLKRHPLFNQLSGGTNDGSNSYLGLTAGCYIVDMNNINFVKLRGRDIQWDGEQQAPGTDGMKGGYTGELAVEVHLPETHARITNFDTGQSD